MNRLCSIASRTSFLLSPRHRVPEDSEELDLDEVEIEESSVEPSSDFTSLFRPSSFAPPVPRPEPSGPPPKPKSFKDPQFPGKWGLVNTSGTVGVFLELNDALAEYRGDSSRDENHSSRWRCAWSIDGTRYRIGFSTRLFGFDAARELAITARRIAEEEIAKRGLDTNMYLASLANKAEFADPIRGEAALELLKQKFIVPLQQSKPRRAKLNIEALIAAEKIPAGTTLDDLYPCRGVFYNPRLNAFTCFHRTGGKNKFRFYNVSTYGFEGAKKMAIDKRVADSSGEVVEKALLKAIDAIKNSIEKHVALRQKNEQESQQQEEAQLRLQEAPHAGLELTQPQAEEAQLQAVQPQQEQEQEVQPQPIEAQQQAEAAKPQQEATPLGAKAEAAKPKSTKRKPKAKINQTPSS